MITNNQLYALAALTEIEKFADVW